MLQEKLKLTESYQSFPEGDSDGDDSLLEDDVLCDQVTFFLHFIWILPVFSMRIRIHQCCGSGSMHRIHMFLGLPDPDQLVRCMDPDPDPSIIMRKYEKNLDSYYFVTLFDFLSLKNDVSVASKSNKQKKLC
jgi:hypothetical protein